MQKNIAYENSETERDKPSASKQENKKKCNAASFACSSEICKQNKNSEKTSHSTLL